MRLMAKKIVRLLYAPFRNSSIGIKFKEMYISNEKKRYLKKKLKREIQNNQEEYSQSIYSEKIKSLKNVHSGQRCFIIGNGPSLKGEDLEKLKGEITFASNYINKIYNMTSWRPTYYCISDYNCRMGMIKSNEINCLEAEKYFFRWYPKDNSYETGFGELPKPYYLFHIPFEVYGGKNIHFSRDISKCTYDANTVTYIMIQIALYMGFKDIYLLGVDHNFPYIGKTGNFVFNDNVKSHFYSSKAADRSEYKSGYIDMASMTKGYRLAKRNMMRKGQRIFNATRGGKLEVFKRVDFDSISF